jgi:hypothetical protein
MGTVHKAPQNTATALKRVACFRIVFIVIVSSRVLLDTGGSLRTVMLQLLTRAAAGLFEPNELFFRPETGTAPFKKHLSVVVNEHKIFIAFKIGDQS